MSRVVVLSVDYFMMIWYKFACFDLEQILHCATPAWFSLRGCVNSTVLSPISRKFSPNLNTSGCHSEWAHMSQFWGNQWHSELHLTVNRKLLLPCEKMFLCSLKSSCDTWNESYVLRWGRMRSVNRLQSMAVSAPSVWKSLQECWSRSKAMCCYAQGQQKSVF